MPALQRILAQDELRSHVRGTVLDLGAGSCWLSALVSRLPQVDRVIALDLSESFLLSVGVRVLKHLGADFSKVVFAASDFNEIPLESESVHCAFVFAAIHHSLSPIKTLQEVGRCLRRGGVMMVLENPSSVRQITQTRERALAMSSDVTEVAYTRGELEYTLRVAGVGSFETLPLDILSRRGVKMVVRRILRVCGLEDLLINPPSYLFVVTKR
jgi:ubiquinone/menaquinone biosynthesis C-methylase UbiE